MPLVFSVREVLNIELSNDKQNCVVLDARNILENHFMLPIATGRKKTAATPARNLLNA